MTDEKLKERYKTWDLPKLKKKAQEVFNAFIRERDSESGCISCPKGKCEQAGHYFNRGQHPALALNEINTNGQCTHCNLYRSGNLIPYREGLIKKYGEAEVSKLEIEAAFYKRTGWKADRFYYITKIIEYKAK